jgi:hypothetical protein
MKSFHTFFTAKAADGIGTPASCTDYNNIALTLDVDATATLTVKFQGSMSETMPDFAASATSTNQWTYIDVIDSVDGASIDGGTGVAISGATKHGHYLVNVDGGLTYVNAIISGRSGGAATCKAMLSNYNK